MSVYGKNILARRIGSVLADGLVEFGGGLLGSYFGAMVAALATALRHNDPAVMQSSIWTGLGFGFAFCSLSLSFVNRVLIQGISRSSIGKKLFNLELVSSTHAFTWRLMIKRWILSEISFAVAGAGYAMMFFNREHRTFHDEVLGTDVVPAFAATHTVSVEYTEHVNEDKMVYPFPSYKTAFSRMIILTNDSAERPTATVIQLPVREKAPDEIVAATETRVEATLADVIELRPKAKEISEQDAAEAAQDSDTKKVA